MSWKIDSLREEGWFQIAGDAWLQAWIHGVCVLNITRIDACSGWVIDLKISQAMVVLQQVWPINIEDALRFWGVPTNFGCTDTKTDDDGRGFFDGSVPGFAERGTRFGKSIGSGSVTKVKRVNGLKGVQNVDMSSGWCSIGGCRRIGLKFLKYGGERL